MAAAQTRMGRTGLPREERPCEHKQGANWVATLLFSQAGNAAPAAADAAAEGSRVALVAEAPLQAPAPKKKGPSVPLLLQPLVRGAASVVGQANTPLSP